MKVSCVRMIYFSATDTTRKIVRQVGNHLARVWNIPVYEDDFTLPPAREQDIICRSDELAVVGVPVYAGRVPNKLLPFIQNHIKGCHTPAVPIVLFGNRAYDDALIELRNVLYENGFCSVAGAAFVGEHSFSDTLAAGRPDEDDLQLADSFANQIVQKVDMLRQLPQHPVAVKGNIPLRPYYTPRSAREYLKVKPVVSSRCDNCGLCAALCPTGAIDPQDIRQYHGACIKCGACIKKCPRSARYFDDEIYLSHKRELEKNFTRRAQAELFL